jgi:hypothetical protein
MGHFTGTPDLVHRFTITFHGCYHVLRYVLPVLGSFLAAFWTSKIEHVPSTPHPCIIGFQGGQPYRHLSIMAKNKEGKVPYVWGVVINSRAEPWKNISILPKAHRLIVCLEAHSTSPTYLQLCSPCKQLTQYILQVLESVEYGALLNH